MKLNEKMTLAELTALVGKKGRFKTLRGKSSLHVIEAIEISEDRAMLVLRENVRLGLKLKRRPELFEIVIPAKAKPTITQPSRKRGDVPA